MTEQAESLALECLLKEADLLQSEMDKRLERHHQSFYLCMLVVAAAIGGYATSLGDFQKENRFLLVLSFFPCLTTPLAAMFFDDELLRAVTDLYTHNHLAPRIRELLRSVGYCDAQNAFDSTLTSRFAYMRRLRNERQLRVRLRVRAGTIRRFLFAIPFIVAAAALGGYWYRTRLTQSNHSNLNHLNVYMSCAALVLDVFLLGCVCLMWTDAARAWNLVSSGRGAKDIEPLPCTGKASRYSSLKGWMKSRQK